MNFTIYLIPFFIIACLHVYLYQSGHYFIWTTILTIIQVILIIQLYNKKWTHLTPARKNLYIISFIWFIVKFAYYGVELAIWFHYENSPVSVNLSLLFVLLLQICLMIFLHYIPNEQLLFGLTISGIQFFCDGFINTLMETSSLSSKDLKDLGVNRFTTTAEQFEELKREKAYRDLSLLDIDDDTDTESEDEDDPENYGSDSSKSDYDDDADIIEEINLLKTPVGKSPSLLLPDD